ncbi:MAG: hypothetical protein PHZ25_03650 [Candidatus Pacebacteria bacterium]|nr:hypothetical protein [Candidatus Paceibacterota bacterium]
MARTLEEVKRVLNTEKVFETSTSFGINMFGKYEPNITFILQKNFEGKLLVYRYDEPVKEMIRGMNVDFDGDVSVLFGDFWKSRKSGGACFRPKPITEANHVLLKVSWGGAFSRNSGMRNHIPEGALYYRRAKSNGGGAGCDYLVVPVGFFCVVHDAEIDGEEKPPQTNFERRAKAVREKFVAADREQRERETAEKKAVTKMEEESRAAKEKCVDRLQEISARLVALGKNPLRLEDDRYWGGSGLALWSYYSERNVLYEEERVASIEERGW